MAIHIIPDHETDEHIESEQCDCDPVFKLDKGSGEMVWYHNIKNYDKLLEGFITLSICLICLAVGLLF